MSQNLPKYRGLYSSNKEEYPEQRGWNSTGDCAEYRCVPGSLLSLAYARAATSLLRLRRMFTKGHLTFPKPADSAII